VDNNEADAAKYAANIIQDSAAEMVYKLNDVVWLINPDKGSLQDLIDKLAEYAHKLCLAKNMKADVQVKGELDYLKLPIGTRRNIYLFCREAINNGAKYSKATILSMEVILHANILKIIIQDNGVGFDMSNVKRGNGLDNMLKRADEMGADVEIQSAPLQGCTILFGLKITQ
jgi:signal transduction histidine kinase